MPLHRPDHLTGPHWQTAGRDLLAKALAEFAYEDLLHPRRTAADHGPDTDGEYEVRLDSGVGYRFLARRGAYESWRIDPASVRRDGRPAHDPMTFLLDARTTLGLTDDTAGHLVRELSATLLADTRHLAQAPSAAALADYPYADLEGHQTGHPWIVTNKGRLGFSATDAHHWAPEAVRPTRLPWLAVHRDLAEYRAVPGLDQDRLYAEELTDTTRATFAAAVRHVGRDPLDYLWLPVHPWQWDEVLLPLFAAEVADHRIIPLPEDEDLRLPQQSVRTFLNVSRMARRTVKLPLSILNTLVWRGLPTERTLAAPAVTSWVLGLRDADPFLRDRCGVVLLGETASVTVRHRILEDIPAVPYQYRELLGAIWREPVGVHLVPGERARTLAALLYTDRAGRSLAAELVARSGLPAAEWTRRLFQALLPPLLHFLYRYGLVFSPHGENTIVVFDDHDAPSRMAVKDFVDDVNVSSAPVPELEAMPDEVAAVLLREPPAFLPQFLHAGLFVGVLRYLAPLLADQADLPEEHFWGLLRAEVLAHHEGFPELAERFAQYPLLSERIDRLCLNRNRLLLDGYRDRPERPHAAVHGTVPNPLFAPTPHAMSDRGHRVDQL